MMMTRPRYIKYFCAALPVTAILVLIAAFSAGADPEAPVVVGWVERVSLHPCNIVIPSKVDTGAVSCSLHAADPVVFQRHGERWVRFTVQDVHGKKHTIETPIVGTRKIKRHFGEFQRRWVIRLGVCLGKVFKESEINLVDRTGFEYPMLIGRNFMEASLIVDPSSKFTVEPQCRPQEHGSGEPLPEKTGSK